MIPRPNLMDLPNAGGDMSSRKTSCTKAREQKPATEDQGSVEQGVAQQTDRPARSSDQPRQLDFARVYRAVARANKEADRSACTHGDPRQRVAPKSAGPKSVEATTTEKSQESEVSDTQDITTCAPEELSTELKVLLAELNGQTPIVAESTGEQNPDSAQTAECVQASLIIVQSLTVLSQTLKMNVSEGMDQMRIQDPSESIINQFSEIVHALNQIASILSDSLKQGEPVELGGQQLTPDQIVSAEQTIRVEVFHMEVAFRMLGVSTDVAAKVAEMQNVPMDVGILKAADPATLAMPESQVKDVFGSVIASREKELRTLLSQVVALLGKSDAPQKPAGAPQPQPTVDKPMPQVAAQAAPLTTPQTTLQTTADILKVGTFDSLVMRRILKIDTMQVTAKGNVEAAAKASEVDLTKALGLAVSKTLDQAAPDRDKNDTLPVLELMGKRGADTLNTVLGSKLATVLTRSLEQTVMEQVVNKFQNVLRTGVHEMKLTLHPESLGEVRLKIEIHNNVVTTRMQVESTQIKQIVESNLGQLKNALAEHNLQAGSFEVNVSLSNKGEHDAQQADDATARLGGADDTDGTSDDEAVEADGVGVTASDTDTGRRFGTNSFEYFA